jgi:hypothetical protein
MSGLLLEQTVPGATTCLLIGDVSAAAAPDLGRYQAVLWWADRDPDQTLPAGLTRDRVQIGRPGATTPAELTPVLERFIRLNPRALPSFFITAAIGGPHADAYQAVITAAHAQLESTRRSRLTRQQDGFAWQKHILQNAAAYTRRRLPAAWAGALRGLPAFVCGAGPSLDVSIKGLAAHADRAVVFAADSALRALARHGVAADFAVSTDAAKVPGKCLPVDQVPARVVLASVSPPAWQAALPADRQFFLSGNQLTDDWLAMQGVVRTGVAAAESCGSTALELAHHLGCDPIYLFGLDLAVDPANQARRHQQDADRALYVKSNYDPTAQLPRVPGNYAETVPCFALGDWRELDARLAARAGGRIFNVNDRGARLRGTTLVQPGQFSLAAPAGLKAARLAALPAARPAPAADAALARIAAVGARCHQALPGLRRALERGGPAAVAAAFLPVVLDAETGRAFGAFALKLMPHLVPPIEGDAAFWSSLLNELEELAAVAQCAGTNPGPGAH